MVLMSCYQEQGWAGLPLSFVGVEGEATKCRLRSLWWWSCRPQPEHVTLLFKSVCVSHCLLAVRCVGWFLGCASFLGPRLNLPQPPTLPLRWASGLLGGGNRGYPAFGGTPGSPSIAQAKTRPQKPSHSRTRRVCSLSVSSQPGAGGDGVGAPLPSIQKWPCPPSPSPRRSAQRGQAPGERRREPGVRTAGAMCV